MKQRSWFEIAEYVALFTSGLGTVATAISSQAVYAAMPITFALSLNVVNRQRLGQQAKRAIAVSQQQTEQALIKSSPEQRIAQIEETLHQQRQAISQNRQRLTSVSEFPQIVDNLSYRLDNLTQQLDSLIPSGFDFDELIRKISQTSNELEVLTTAFNRLEIPQPVDLSGINGQVSHIADKLSNVQRRLEDRVTEAIAQINSRLENLSDTEVITQIQNRLNTLVESFNTRPERQTIPNIIRDVKALSNQLSYLSDNQVIVQITQQIEAVNAQINSLPKQEAIAQITAQLTTLTDSLNNKTDISDISEIKDNLNNLKHQFNNLVITAQVDIIGVRGEIAEFRNQLKNLSDAEIITQIISEIKSLNAQVANLYNQDETVLGLIDNLTPLPEQLHNLSANDVTPIKEQLTQLIKEFQSRPDIHAIAQIKSDLTLLIYQFTNRAEPQYIQELNNQLANLQQELNEKIGEIIIPITDQLTNLSYQLNHLSDIEIITQIISQIESLNAQVNSLPAPVNISGIQREIADVYTLLDDLTNDFNQRTDPQDIQQIIERFIALDDRFNNKADIRETAEVRNNLNTLESQFNNLVIPAQVDLTGVQKEIAEFRTRLDDLGISNANSHDRITKLNRKTNALDSRIQPLQTVIALIQENIASLPQPLQLNELQGVITSKVNDSVKQWATQINQQLLAISPFEYQLVVDRPGSRAVLMEFLNISQRRLIIVCPWLKNTAINYELINNIRRRLQQGVCIDIGWGNRSDFEPFNQPPIPFNRQNARNMGWKYNALPELIQLEQEYPQRFRMKLLGTHEKFLVCDDKFAMLGSHNVLTSGTYSQEREIGLKTNDPRIINELIYHYESAVDLDNLAKF